MLINKAWWNWCSRLTADRNVYKGLDANKDSYLFPGDAPPAPTGAGITVNVNSQIAVLQSYAIEM